MGRAQVFREVQPMQKEKLNTDRVADDGRVVAKVKFDETSLFRRRRLHLGAQKFRVI